MEFFNFLEFKLSDVIDIMLMAFLLYYLYKLVKGTVAINIFIGIVIIFAIWKITEALQMELLSNVFGKFIGVGVFALIVVFQQEIRKFLLLVGSAKFTRNSFMRRLQFLNSDRVMADTDVEQLIKACVNMGKSKTGALIVIERSHSLDFVKSSGDKMNIEISLPILESIFYKNSPLHDGAAVIEGNFIVATRVTLPVSPNLRIPMSYGLRHRAAVSITLTTDALAVVVSEETGTISYISNGKFRNFKDPKELIELIERDLS